MKKILLLLILCFGTIFPQGKKVYDAAIEGTIDLGLVPYVKRVISEAEAADASALVFRINTFGGRVDAATQIKDAILNSRVTTIAFIDKRAISAGALIALSCRKIAMVPGSSIGASTVVDEAGRKQSEKYQSYMRGEMRSTAERNGRRTDIAEGMVDERIIIKGLVDSTQLVTLTSGEARKYAIADTVVNNIDELLSAFSIKQAVIVEAHSNWAEDLVRFLNNPIVSSLLIMIGLVGIFIEIKTPGAVLPGLTAVIALLLFFGSGYILQLASIMDIVLFIIGVVLLLLEIFVIPGFGVVGILGIVAMVAGLFMSLISDFKVTDPTTIRIAILQLAGAFASGAVIIFTLLKFLPKTETFNKLILHNPPSGLSGSPVNPVLNTLTGAEGTALTVLRPSGTALFNDVRIDVVTEGDYIEQGKPIVVLKVVGSKVIVKESRHA